MMKLLMLHIVEDGRDTTVVIISAFDSFLVLLLPSNKVATATAFFFVSLFSTPQ